MIPPQEAVSKAKKYLLELAPGELIEDLRLEEVEFEESKKLWLITLGFFRPHQITNTGELAHATKRKSTLASLFHEEPAENQASKSRIYKRLAIDAESGDFRSMTIREVH
jgi:hypothetical protein